MRPFRRVAGSLALATMFGAVGVLLAPAAQAHPLGNFTINRSSGLVLSPGRISVRYIVDMAEIPTAQEMARIDTDGDGTATAIERQAWADVQAPRLLSGLRLSEGGSPVALRVSSAVMRFRSGQAGLPILYLVGVFEGPLPATGSLTFEDRNYPDRIGWKEVTATSTAGVALGASSVPTVSVSHELQTYPVDLLANPLSVTEATVAFHPGVAASAPQDPTVRTVSGSPVASGGGFAALVNRRLTPVVLVLALGLAFLFGALHALGPGHGKTITAAYLVGSRARVQTAVLAGAAVSVMHTVSVLALGVVALVLLKSFPTERVYPWLGLLTGVVALGLGSALLRVRLRALREGRSPWVAHGQSHGPDHDHEHEEGHGHAHHDVLADVPERELVGVGARSSSSAVHVPAAPARPSAIRERAAPDLPPLRSSSGHQGLASRRGLAALAVAGGILPSPTAIVVLTAAISYHRLAYGLGLIAAFSLGLASALVAVGLVALRAQQAFARRARGRWGSLLPIASAAVIVGLGMFFLVRGLTQV